MADDGWLDKDDPNNPYGGDSAEPVNKMSVGEFGGQVGQKIKDLINANRPKEFVGWTEALAPLALEGVAAANPEVTLPALGAVELGKYAEPLVSSIPRRLLTSGVIGAIANKLSGGSATRGGLQNMGAQAISELVAGVPKAIGQEIHGKLKGIALDQASDKIEDAIQDRLPELPKRVPLPQLFSRATPASKSVAERTYGDALDRIENGISKALPQTKGKLIGFNAAGQAIRAPGTGTTFTVSTYDPVKGWVKQDLPFGTAVSAMRSKYPLGYRLTGTERDSAVADQWRDIQKNESAAILAKLKSIDPALAKAWQGARYDWATARHLSNVFGDPKSYDPATGMVNTENVARHLYGETPAKLNEKQELAQFGGQDFANRLHAAATHQKYVPGQPLKQVRDVIKPDRGWNVRLHVGLNPFSLHPPESGFHPGSTETLPFTEKSGPRLGYSVLRAIARNSANQAAGQYFPEDNQ